jgi:hypothetical protein
VSFVNIGIENYDMRPIRELLGDPGHWTGDAEKKHRAVREMLGQFVTNTHAPLWIQALAAFVLERPFRYWDHGTVAIALDLLEREPARSADALEVWHTQLSVGFDALFAGSTAALSDERLRTYHVRDIVRLGTVYHPEYLRYAEHVFGNLVPLYWAVQRKGGVAAKFDLSKAVGELRRNGYEALVEGFNDRVRNGIAHGEITFRGTAIRYGPPIADYEIEPSKVVAIFDDLVRAANALALAILLFWCRNDALLKDRAVRLPIRLLAFIAAAAVDQRFVVFEGAYESENALAGRQLHIGLLTHLASREFVLLTVGTIAYHLVQFGALNYDRVAFEIIYPRNEVEGLVVVNPGVLNRLLDEGATVDRFGEMVIGDPLLWSTESRWRTRLRVFSAIALTRLELAKQDFHRERVRLGRVRDHGGFWIRGFTDNSVGAVRRAEIHVVLRCPEDAEDRDRLRAVARLAVKEALRRPVMRRTGGIGSESGWRTRARQVGVRIYQRDGPLRWLIGGGSAGGNLVAVAESRSRRAKSYNHVFVPEPDEVWRGLRFKYLKLGAMSDVTVEEVEDNGS